MGDGGARVEELEREIARLTTEVEAAQRDAALCHAILESATDYAIFTLDPSGRVTSWNAGAGALLGWSEAEALGMDGRAVFVPEDRRRGAPEAEMACAAAEGRAEDQRWHLRKDGSRFWGSGLLLPLRGARPGGYLKIMRDRTQQRQAGVRQDLLLRELAHRVKNSLALILAMARQTGDRSRSVAEFLDGFEGRLRALAAAHDLLNDSGWLETSLPALVRAALAPHAGEDGGAAIRVRASVPDVPLHPALAQDLVLALHELATNAAKHGALSVEGGTATLAGSVAGGVLQLVWSERGGPSAGGPPAAPGFGTRLLEQAIAHQHRGEVRLDWRAEGLTCTMRLPLRAPPG